MKLTEIASRIDAHLKRFENDPEINAPRDATREQDRVGRYFRAYSWGSGRYVYVVYISFQGKIALTKPEAEKYLAWLDAGNVGKHWLALEER